MNKFEYLFSPGKIGTMELKNRIIMPAVHANYAPDGTISPKIINYYRERARGGAGLIITGGCAIDDVGAGPLMIKVSGPEYKEGLAELAAGVKKEGAKVALQLYHSGRYAFSAFTGIQPIAPSPIASRLNQETPRELATAEIPELIDKFVRAAVLVNEAGFDAVEVLAGAGYIISQFLSPLTNKREDEYGGSPENRMRFGLEVAGKIRAAVGPEFPVMVRLAGNDYMEDGNTNEEAVAFSRRLQDAGVDCINVTGGWHETLVPQTTMGVPPGVFVYLAQNIKKNLHIPVVASNRINDPYLAEGILRDGRADFIGMARVLIADPEFPEKALRGREKSIRKCIGCNQGCMDYVFSLQPLTCLVNPRVGREEETKIIPADKKKKILVIGGGAAGMEFARVAAMRGHRVSLWEKSSRPGGQLHLAAAPPGRGDFANFAAYLANQMEELAVEVKLNTEADRESIAREKFDTLVVATGALPANPPLPGSDLPHVVSAWDVLEGDTAVGNRVVIVGGGAVGVETAVYIAETGAVKGEDLRFLLLHNAEELAVLKQIAARGHKDITIVEMVKGVGKDIGLSTRWTILAALKKSGVAIRTKSTVQEITPEGVKIETAEGTEFIPADTVVLAIGSKSDDSLYNSIKESYPEVYLVGDAYSPRKALEAVRDAFELGLKV